MLVEYNVDTDELNMHDRAIELRRRVAGRRLEDAAATGKINDMDVIAMKEKNRDEKNQLVRANIEVTSAAISDRIALSRADQHLKAVNQVRVLGNDITRASKLSKSRMDALSELEKKILLMRQSLHQPGEIAPEVLISKELSTNTKGIALEKKFDECPCCKRKILIALLENHKKMCTQENQSQAEGKEPIKSQLKGVNRVEDTLITSLTTFKPQPPRNFKLVRKGIAFVEWKWEPPVIDGGLVITEYEISYRAKHSRYDREKAKYTKWEEASTITTTNFCYRDNPVCHFGYKMVNLRAGSEYSHFRIRSYNIRGWSEWVDMLEDPSEKVKLLPESPPTIPLFVNCDRITSSRLHISWEAPIFDGGLPIINYEVYYTVVELQLTVTDRSLRVDHHLHFSTHSNQSSAIICNLPDDTDIINIFIVAENQHHLMSEKGHNKQAVCRTTPCCRYTLLQREFDRAMNIVGEWIDTSFFNGVRQRINRLTHMKQLKEELEVTQPDEDELQERKEWVAFVETKKAAKEAIEKALKEAKDTELLNKVKIRGVETGDDATDEESVQQRQVQLMSQRLQGGGFTFSERRLQFQHKLKALQNEISELNLEKLNIDRQRIEFTNKMRKKEKVLLSYTLERERFKNYTGKVITSNVLTGSDMQYNILDYQEKLDVACSQVIEEIGKMKFTVITNENRRHEIKDEVVRVELEIKEKLAQFLDFENQYTRTIRLMNKLNLHKTPQSGDASTASSLSGTAGGGLQLDDEQMMLENKAILRLYFQNLFDWVEERKKIKQRVIKLFTQMIYLFKVNAFTLWKQYYETLLDQEDSVNRLKGGGGDDNGGAEDDDTTLSSFTSKKGKGMIKRKKPPAPVTSVGTMMLQDAYNKRLELQDSLRSVMNETSTISQQLSLQHLSNQMAAQMTKKQDFKFMEEGINHHSLFHYQNMQLFYEGNGYLLENKFALALEMFEAQIMSIRAKVNKQFYPTLSSLDIKLLAMCHHKLGMVFLKAQESLSRSIVEFDRQLSLAKEIHDQNEITDAYFGLGLGYFVMNDYYNSIYYFNLAQSQYALLLRFQKYVTTLNYLKACYEKLYQPDKIALIETRLASISLNISTKVNTIHKKLKEMEDRLLFNAAEIEYVIKMERTTYQALSFRKKVQAKSDELKQFEDVELVNQQNVVKGVENILDRIQMEMKEAYETDANEVWSELVHDQPQLVEVEELKIRLKQRIKIEVDNLAREKEIEKNILVKIRNVLNEIQENDQQLSLEEGALMKHSRLDKPFRLVGLCQSNAAGNEVTGTATGGQEEFIAAESNSIHVIDYHSGELKHVFIGGNVETGHVGVVTCLLHDGEMIFTGGTDERILCWNLLQRTLIRKLEGHEGSIVCLASDYKHLISSAADTTMRLWRKSDGKQLRVIFGHGKSVLSMEIGPTWLLTSSTDEEVRVWKIAPKGKSSVSVDCTHRLLGHEVPVTCVRYGTVEVISADTLGRIFIWWLKTGQVIRKSQVHKGPIKCLQFDSVHIVSGGIDHTVCVTDIATGEVLQSLHGHTGPILALAFDAERILTVGGDNSVRYWQWGKRTGPQDKFHVLGQSETLASVAKQYGITIENVMKWNGIGNGMKTHPGMKLVVKKGDPNALTEAERVAEERDLRRARGMAWSSKKLSKVSYKIDVHRAYDDRYHRIHELALNDDYFSLANRLFGSDNRKLDLFPDTTNFDADKTSLAARIVAAQEDFTYKQEHPTSALQMMSDPTKRSKIRPRYFISGDNEDEWGDLSDAVGNVMLEMLIELQAYEVVIEQKKVLRDKQSVLGRIFAHQNAIVEQQKKDGTYNNPGSAPSTPSSTPKRNQGRNRTTAVKLTKEERKERKLKMKMKKKNNQSQQDDGLLSETSSTDGDTSEGEEVGSEPKRGSNNNHNNIGGMNLPSIEEGTQENEDGGFIVHSREPVRSSAEDEIAFERMLHVMQEQSAKEGIEGNKNNPALSSTIEESEELKLPSITHSGKGSSKNNIGNPTNIVESNSEKLKLPTIK